jgi:hypothetical protein
MTPTTKISIIDHLPMNSTARYSRARWSRAQVDRRWVTAAIRVIAMIFSSGTMTLAKKMRAASGQEPLVQR